MADQAAPVPQSNSTIPVTRILSIDGGGIRGVIPAMVLAEIEDRTKKTISQLFDVIAGTSTGGILALGLACPNSDGTGPKYSAHHLVDLYAKEGQHIFPPSRIRSVLWVIEPKYSPRGLESVLHRYFDDTKLAEAVVDVFVPAYDIEHRNVMFFRSRVAKTCSDYNFEMGVVARATSAAPTYFPPLSLNGLDGSPSHFTLIDGGVVLNDPALAAYMDDCAGQGAHPDKVMIVSLGTGSDQTPITYKQAKRWGMLRWAHPLLDVALDGGPEVTEYWLKKLLQSNYHRFQASLARVPVSLDASTPADIATLQRVGADLVSSHGAELDVVCAQLLETAPRPPVDPFPCPGIRGSR